MKFFAFFGASAAMSSFEILEKSLEASKKIPVESSEMTAWSKMAKSVVLMAKENSNIDPDFDEIIRRGKTC